MGEVGQIYTLHRVGRRFKSSSPSISRYYVDEVVFDWTRDLSSIEAACTDVVSIAKACGFADASNEKDSHVECAVYVIGVDGLPVSKIGISCNPTARLAQLQEAHWTNLSIHALLWFPTRKSETVEQTALKAATEMNCRLKGEWVALDPAEALNLVCKAARYHRIPACDSATWLENWKRRVDGLAGARQWVSRVTRPLRAA